MQNNTLEKAAQLPPDVFETFNALPQETKDAYRKCMSTEAVIFSAIPLGALSAFVTYKVVPFKPTSTVGRVTIAFMGLLGYVAGRVHYSLVCLEKHAPSMVNVMKNRRDFDMSNYNRRSEPMNTFGQLTEQQPLWSSLDTYADSNIGSDDQLDTFNDSGEELLSDKPINLKPRVTYDTLRNKNRAEYYSNYHQSYRFMGKEKPKPDKELMDDTDFKSDTKEDNIWS